MWEIRVVHVGRIADANIAGGVSRYASMVGGEWRLRMDAVPASKRRGPRQIRREEGRRLLDRASGDRALLALDAGGRLLDSTVFARLLVEYKDQGKRVSFLVGGAYGLDEEVLRASDKVLSLSPMTLPHEMALLVLTEQIYRAFAASTGRAYAK
jgi:23S rRNA (pseudouridine1915-N3)-methyltransferase